MISSSTSTPFLNSNEQASIKNTPNIYPKKHDPALNLPLNRSNKRSKFFKLSILPLASSHPTTVNFNFNKKNNNTPGKVFSQGPKNQNDRQCKATLNSNSSPLNPIPNFNSNPTSNPNSNSNPNPTAISPNLTPNPKLISTTQNTEATANSTSSHSFSESFLSEILNHKEGIDVVILSNGPGEVSSWVRPVVKALRNEITFDSDILRISVVLAPCSHASGREFEVVSSFTEVDRVSHPSHFFPFLAFGKSPSCWKWKKYGVCIFLGGDQLNTIIIANRLKYKSLIYAEENVQWVRFANAYALRSEKLMNTVNAKFKNKCHVIGDLFFDSVNNMYENDNNKKKKNKNNSNIHETDSINDGNDVNNVNYIHEKNSINDIDELIKSKEIKRKKNVNPRKERHSNDIFDMDNDYNNNNNNNNDNDNDIDYNYDDYDDGDDDVNHEEKEKKVEDFPIIGLLPGSKGVKLKLGVPFMLSFSDHLYKLMNGRVFFLLFLAPTVELSHLAQNACVRQNLTIAKFGWGHAKLIPLANFNPNNNSTNLPNSNSNFNLPNSNLNSTFHLPNSNLNSTFHLPNSNLDSNSNFVSNLNLNNDCQIDNVFVTPNGVPILICESFPAYDVLKKCDLCLTTVGTNTAELGILNIPMLLILPFQALTEFKGALGGIYGLLSRLPGSVGDQITKTINLKVIQTVKFLAWPNRWAGKEVVPELIGEIEPEDAAEVARELLNSPEKLQKIRTELLKITNGYRVSGGNPSILLTKIALNLIQL